MRKLMIVVALLAVLLFGFGCVARPGSAPEGTASSGGNAGSATGGTSGTRGVTSNITAADFGILDSPDSESLDTGIPLENI